ncbi:3-hydroxybutyrate dehydrogenase [Usitatibacter palustris]|uniref:D-beta-hydroxybutyrate dehydrogenase n=1 Tax=Usitatibacter palustris TaxID=2732487 RepID=A0A6M4H3Z9_9PROT|nr:3-hydroxybutyrate dehydrogenase [Usitatibacter palustris]QJR14170.1 D-beta-hydroxybutyrate dehydrogenase [Usitatibacter palustris]
MSHPLKDRAAVVTGSTSGIGLAIATLYARAGAKVMLNGLGDAAAIEQTRAALEKAAGVEVRYHGANMMKPAEIADLVATAEAAFGSVDILVNNAGIQHVAPVEDFPADKWDAIIAINLSSAFHATKAALPGMKKRRFGRIVNIASAHGLVASPNKSAYIASKHGLIGFTKAVAVEVAEHGVRANAICPGFVHTPLVQKQIEDRAREAGISEERAAKEIILAPQPTKEFVTVEQIAAMALYLASDAAAQINGASFSIDGGWTAR